jgi:hypothetical protein
MNQMKTLKCLLLVASALLLLFGACGNESGQVAPAVDTVPPNPPVGLQVQEGAQPVRLSWSENAEVDLAGYRIYKSSYEAGPYRLLNSDLLLCPWHYDTVSPMMMTFYKVTAVDASGNESAFSEVMGVYWNNGGRSGPAVPVQE